MVIVPKTAPVIGNLNSYYLNIDRFIEHFGGELASGGIHFVSNTAEGMLFFDDTALVGGVLEDKTGRIFGPRAVADIIENLKNNNFTIAVYRIGPDILHFWSHLANAKPLHSDLSAEFTDLGKLIAKMREERLTGFIDIATAADRHGGIVCFIDGNIIDCSGSWGPGSKPVDTVDGNLQMTLEAIQREAGAVFNVCRVDLSQTAPRTDPPPPAADSPKPKAAPEKKAPAAEPTLDMIRDLLLVLEKTVKTHNRRKAPEFDKLLRKKFMQKADRYDFLDPFTAEFEYSDGAVRFNGSATTAELFQGVVESIKEMADDLGLLYEFLVNIEPWKEKYAAVTARRYLDI